MAARTGVAEGLRTGVWLAVGIGLGAAFWALVALFGLAVLFQVAPALLWGFKLAGGLFLIWMAVWMWQHARDPLDIGSHDTPPRSAASALRLGVVTQMSNPKPAVFFGAVFVGTVPPGTSAPWIALLLVVIFLNELLCNTVVARAFSFDGPRRTYQRLKTAIDRSFAGGLAVLGARIALP